MKHLAGSDPQNRRAFIRNAAGVGTALVAGGVLSACASAGGATSAAAARRAAAGAIPVGVQLYTVRDQLQADFEGTLEQVAEIGYREFEFAGYYDHSSVQIRNIHDRLDRLRNSGQRHPARG